MSQILPAGTATILEGNSSISVTHTLGYVPDVTKIFLQAQSDLGGAYFLPCTNPTATTFDINLSSIVLSDALVSWFINQPTLGTALYATVAAVKRILVETSVTYDVEIAECIVSSDALVVGLLTKAGLTVPSPIHQNLVDASNYFAAWMFRKRRDVQSAWIFFVDAERFLNAYVESQVYAAAAADQDLPIAIGQDTS
jgi:hypothetical protein